VQRDGGTVMLIWVSGKEIYVFQNHLTLHF